MSGQGLRGDWDATPVRDAGTGDADADREGRVAPAVSADGRVHGRPAPQYGEYAPDGWVNPVLVEQERREQERREQERREQERRDRERFQQDQRRPARPSAAGSDRPGAPGAPGAAGADADLPVAMRYGANPTDFVLTIGLLVFGIVSVVRTANPSALASGLRQSLERQYTALSDPAALSTGAVLTVIANVVILLVVVVWTLARLRARKRSFWVPLAGGAVASAFTAAVFLFIVLQDHAIVQYMLEHSAG